MKMSTLGLAITVAAFTFLIAGPPAANAQIVYSNDFETNTDGFNVTNTIILPSDGGGGTSTYLGSRTPPSSSAVLTLTGLTVGVVYDLAFDVYIGGTWDGSVAFGPDFFTVTSSSAGTLVNATFRNGFPIGNPTPSQSYSDATPLGDGGLFRTREGSDVELAEAIYYFGHGAGNPLLSFTASSTTETITFSSVDAQGVIDEFFALDNVVVSTEPPATPPTITNGPPPNGTVGLAYEFSYTSTGSPTFSVTAGSLPPGLTLSSEGVISGTPTTQGTFTGTVTATNGTEPDATQDFSIVIAAEEEIPTLSTWALILLAGLLAAVAFRYV